MIKHIMTRAFKGYEFIIPDAVEAEIRHRIDTAKNDLVELSKWKPYGIASVVIDDLVGDAMVFPALYENNRFSSQSEVTEAYAAEFWGAYRNPSIWGSVKYDKVDGTFDVGVFLSYEARPEYADSAAAIVEGLTEFCEDSAPLADTVGTLKLEFAMAPDGMFTISDMPTYGVEAVDPASGVSYRGVQVFSVDVTPEDTDYAYWALTTYLKALKDDAVVFNFDSFQLESLFYSAFSKLQEFAKGIGENPPSEPTEMKVEFDGRYAGTYFKLIFIPTSNNK